MPIVKKSKAHINLGTNKTAVVKLFKAKYDQIASILGITFVSDDTPDPSGKDIEKGIANARRAGLVEVNIRYDRADGTPQSGKVYCDPEKVAEALTPGATGLKGKKYGNFSITDAYLDIK